MNVTRRELLTLASAAGMLSLAGGARAAGQPNNAVQGTGTRTADHREAISRLQGFAAAELADKGIPGMTIALLGASGFTAVLPIGYANVERRLPVRPEHLFQIGSITKSMVGLSIFVLVDQGRVDLDARVQDLLPEHLLPREPITLQQLLDHRSGLPRNGPLFPPVPGNRLWTGFAPGSRFYYSNLGFVLLGSVLERVSGLAYGAALQTLVLRPLGMTSAEPVIRIADRSRYATGYTKERDDLPWLPGAELEPARWLDVDQPSGSVAATSADMLRYLAYLVALGRGRGAPLLSNSLAERFVASASEVGAAAQGVRYGNGLGSRVVEGRLRLQHDGSMIGFSSDLAVDPAAGVACYAAVNVGSGIGYTPAEVTDYACGLLRATAESTPLGEPRQLRRPPPVRESSRFVGRWVGSGAEELTIVERGGALFLAMAGSERPLRPAGSSALVTDHPALPEPRLTLEPDAAPLLRSGDRFYGRGAAPVQQATASRLAGLAGAYYNPGRAESRVRVFAAGDRLFVGGRHVTQAPDGSWRYSDADRVAERIWFESIVGGRSQTINLSGYLFDRVHDASL